MKWLILIVISSLTAACASGAGSSAPGVSPQNQPIVLDCPDGWVKCVSSANKLCGPRGFDEISRVRDAYMTSSARLDDQNDGRHIIREDVRIENQNETMVIQCR